MYIYIYSAIFQKIFYFPSQNLALWEKKKYFFFENFQTFLICVEAAKCRLVRWWQTQKLGGGRGWG